MEMLFDIFRNIMAGAFVIVLVGALVLSALSIEGAIEEKIIDGE